MKSEITIRGNRIKSELIIRSTDMTSVVEESSTINSSIVSKTRQLDINLIESQEDTTVAVWLRAGTSQHIHNNFPLLQVLGIDSDNELTLNGKKVYDGSKESYTPTVSDGLFIEDENGDLRPKLKANGSHRGIWTNSFISCRGLDNTATMGGSGLDRTELFDILSSVPQEGESINDAFLNLGDFLTNDEFSNVIAPINDSIIVINTNISTLQGYFDNGSAKSAVKLRDTRKLWGNDFNGTQDVNSTITFSNGSKLTPKDNGIESSVGFYSQSFISCKGIDTNANTTTPIDLGDMWETLTNNDGEYANIKINIAHIPTISINDIDGVNGLLSTYASKNITISAGNGLTGGGNLQANRTISLGTPSSITNSSTNSVTESSHTHAIDKASTSVVGIVKLYDSLNSTSTTLALTANQGKKIDGRLVLLEDMWENKDTYLLAKKNRGIASNSFISCKGVDNTSNGGNSSIIDMTAMWDELSSQGTEKIHSSHIDTDAIISALSLGTFAYKDSLQEIDIPNLSISKITNLQTTLGGMQSDIEAIDSKWVLENGTLKTTYNVQGNEAIFTALRVPKTSPSISNGEYYLYSDTLGTGASTPSSGGGMDATLMWSLLEANTNEKISNSHLNIFDATTNKIAQGFIPDYLLGQVMYGGTINASALATLTNSFKVKYNLSNTTLTITTANASTYEGVYFIASADASSLLGISDVKKGDWVISNGSAWVKVDNTDAVTSVCGNVGAVTADQIKTAIGLSNYALTSAIPTVNNTKITIKQKGEEVKSFTLNQSGNPVVIELTDNDTIYTLPTAKSNVLGGIKVGSWLNVTTDGTLSVNIDEQGGLGATEQGLGVESIPISKVTDLQDALNGKQASLGYTPFNADDFTQANIKSTLGIKDWALATNKPSYSFSEIGSKPTTISGYGITDAITTGNIGSQSVNYANALAKTYSNESINYTRNENKLRMICTNTATKQDGYPNEYVSGLSCLTSYTGWQMVTYGGGDQINPYFRKVADTGVWSDWYRIAFLSDTVANSNNLGGKLPKHYRLESMFELSGSASQRWVRVAKITSPYYTFIISIVNLYNHRDNDAITLCVSLSYGNYYDITKLNSGSFSGKKRARIVKMSSNEYYLDISTLENGNVWGVSISQWSNCEQADKIELYSTYTEITATDLNVVKELDLTKGSNCDYLNTSRTLWGQSFDGSGNVDGNLTMQTLNTSDAPILAFRRSENYNIDAGEILFRNDINGVKVSSKYADWAGRQDLVFYTSNNTTAPYTSNWVETMRISHNDRVGIGLESPMYPMSKLEVNVGMTSSISAGALGNNKTVGFTNENKYGIYFWVKGTGNSYIQVGRQDGQTALYDLVLQNLGGKVGVGTETPSEKLEVSGNIKASGNMSCNGLELPTSAPSNPVSGKYYLYIG